MPRQVAASHALHAVLLRNIVVILLRGSRRGFHLCWSQIQPEVWTFWLCKAIDGLVHLAAQLQIYLLLALGQVDQHRQEVDDDEAADSAHIRQNCTNVLVEQSEHEIDKDDGPSEE